MCLLLSILCSFAQKNDYNLVADSKVLCLICEYSLRLHENMTKSVGLHIHGHNALLLSAHTASECIIGQLRSGLVMVKMQMLIMYCFYVNVGVVLYLLVIILNYQNPFSSWPFGYFVLAFSINLVYLRRTICCLDDRLRVVFFSLKNVPWLTVYLTATSNNGYRA